MIQSYKKKHQVEDFYDTILIGSGLGSLTTAVLLAQAGQKVLVLERHYTAGGFTHIFKRRGYEWDVGIHYIGEVHRPNSILRKLFDHVTNGQLEWADMGEVYDRIVIGERVYDFVKGVSRFKEQMIGYFPEEEESIHRYVDLVFEATRTSRNYYLEKAMPALLSKVAGGFMRKPFLSFSDRTTREVLESITQNQELIKVLTGQYGDYGLAPADSSFAMHASLVRHYFSGGNFPVGGSGRIVETMVPGVTEAGGAILVNAEVDEVLVEKDRAVGVRMKDGRIFRSKNVVSGAGFFTTVTQLLPQEIVEKQGWGEKLQQVNPSVSHACLYIGLQGSPEELKLPKANYWIYPPDTSHEESVRRYLADITQPFPVVYISFPAAKDPDWPRRYPDRSTIDIITLMPYEAVAAWEGMPWKKRGEAYEKLKEQISHRLLAELYRLEPQLEGKIDHYELSTPLTTRHFVNYEKGEIYGLDHSPARFRQRFLRPATPLKGLYLTGQDIVTAGIGGALFSGLLTASAMLKKNLMKSLG